MTSRIVIPVLDSLEQNDKPLVKTILKGVKQLQQQTITASSHSTTQTTFSIQPPSQNSILDRKIELECAVDLARTIVAGNQNLWGSVSNAAYSADGAAIGAENTNQNFGYLRSLIYNQRTAGGANSAAQNSAAVSGGVVHRVVNNFGCKAFPLTQCMESIDLVINGTHFSVTPNQYLTAVMKYTSSEYREKNFGSVAHAPARGTGSFAPNGDHLDSRCLSNSVTQGNGRGNGAETPNGFPWATRDDDKAWGSIDGVATSTPNGGINMRFLLTEPLFISPLMAVCGHGLTNVNNIDITIRWGDMKRAFELRSNAVCGMSGRTLPNTRAELTDATITASVFTGRAAKLRVNYYVAQDDVKIPNEIVLPYKQPQIHISPAVTLLQNTDKLVSLNNQRLNQIPDCVYIYARPQRADLNVVCRETHYPRIKKIELQWKNRTGILSGYDEKGLYDIFRDNGLDSSWDEVAHMGCVAKLEFGKDVPLDDNESPGTRGDYNWRCDVTFNNPLAHSGSNPANTNTLWEVYQVFVMNGHAIVSPNECRVMTGVLDLKDNVSASEMGHAYGDARPEVVGGSFIGGSAVGGSLIGGMSSHIKRVYDMGKKGKEMYDKAKPCVGAVSDAVKEYRSRA